MKLTLAWHNLLHSKLRTAVALAGVTFAVVLIFMQLGFLGAVESTATLIYDALEFDLLVRSRQYLHVSDARSFPRKRLYQAASVAGVQSVSPFYIELNQWRNPRSFELRGILTMGVEPDQSIFRVPEISAQQRSLTTPEQLLIDRKTRPEFGPRDRQFGDGDLQVETEIGRQKVRIAGHFELGTGLAANGAVLLNHHGFARISPGRTEDDVSLGLVCVDHPHDPGTLADTAQRLRTAMGAASDVEILTREEALAEERYFWLRDKSIGIMFQIGVVVAFIVGTAIVYQVLSADVANHLGEYATLKAMGYGKGDLSFIILAQALAMSVLGFIPGWLLAWGLYWFTSQMAGVSISMRVAYFAIVLISSTLMCSLSGWGALRKVHHADPADLF